MRYFQQLIHSLPINLHRYHNIEQRSIMLSPVLQDHDDHVDTYVDHHVELAEASHFGKMDTEWLRHEEARGVHLDHPWGIDSPDQHYWPDQQSYHTHCACGRARHICGNCT